MNATAATAYDSIPAFLLRLAHGFSADACNDFSDAGRWKSFRAAARDYDDLSILVAKGDAMGTTTLVSECWVRAAISR